MTKSSRPRSAFLDAAGEVETYGWDILFLWFAVLLLCVPATILFAQEMWWEGALVTVAVVLIVIVGVHVRRLRSQAMERRDRMRVQKGPPP